jgi:hypothetical protein
MKKLLIGYMSYIVLACVCLFILPSIALAGAPSPAEIEGGGWFSKVLGWATAVVTAANAITAMTPTKTDNMVVNVAMKVLNFAAFNFGRNKNADDV